MAAQLLLDLTTVIVVTTSDGKCYCFCLDLSEKQIHQQTALWELIKTEVAYIKTLKVVTDVRFVVALLIKFRDASQIPALPGVPQEPAVRQLAEGDRHRQTILEHNRNFGRERPILAQQSFSVGEGHEAISATALFGDDVRRFLESERHLPVVFYLLRGTG